MKSQLADYLNAEVIKRFGKYTIELVEGQRLCITDGYMSNWIICYISGRWASDMPIFRKDIRQWLDNNCHKYLVEW